MFQPQSLFEIRVIRHDLLSLFLSLSFEDIGDLWPGVVEGMGVTDDYFLMIQQFAFQPSD